MCENFVPPTSIKVSFLFVRYKHLQVYIFNWVYSSFNNWKWRGAKLVKVPNFLKLSMERFLCKLNRIKWKEYSSHTYSAREKPKDKNFDYNVKGDSNCERLSLYSFVYFVLWGQIVIHQNPFHISWITCFSPRIWKNCFLKGYTRTMIAWKCSSNVFELFYESRFPQGTLFWQKLLTHVKTFSDLNFCGCKTV